MKKLLFTLYLSCVCGILSATPTTEGTEFWTTFLKNHLNEDGSPTMKLTLIVSSRENATVTVLNPQTGWSQSVYVSANQIKELEVPHVQAYTNNVGRIEKRGLKITSTSPISLYASNYDDASYDASIVLPTTALGLDYILQIYENELAAKELAVVATTNNTTITITPHARTTDGHIKNIPYSITLNAGETYQVMSEDEGSDFSGSRVEANYPIAVFSGHQCINVPTGNQWCDHVVEQQMPTHMWGKRFALTKTNGMNGDRVVLIAKENNTIIKINGVQKRIINALETYTFRLTDNSAFVETSAPASCFVYIEGAEDNNMMGDPSSVHISPIEQRIQQLTFSTFQTERSRSHYVNLVTTAIGVATITLDGISIADQFQPLNGNNQLYYASIKIAHGTHTLHCRKDGFIGHVYGLGICESYAYTIGSATLPLDGQILVDNEPRSDIEYEDTRCYQSPITFAPQSNVEFSSILWNLGDGTISSNKTITHTYSAPGTYRVSMIITNSEQSDTAYTTLRLIDQLRDTIYAEVCQGEIYTVGTQSFSTTGTYDINMFSHDGCDSIVTLHLLVHDNYKVIVTDSFPIGASYRWHGNWYRNPGIYTDTLLSKYGCDSIVELTLTQTDPTEIMYDTICWQEYYTFKGFDYPLPAYEKYTNEDYMNVILEHRDKVECKKYKMKLAIVPMENGQSRIIYDTIMIGDTYDFYGEQLTDEGTYYNTINSACDCQINYTLHLTVLTFPLTQINATLCHEDSFVFRGKSYYETGVYYDTVCTMLGIDTIYHITISDNRSRTEFNISNVNSYDFNGQILTESGTYYDTIPNAAGCDSIIILHLGIDESCEINVEENMSLCEGESIMWNGQNCIAGNDYVATFTSVGGCDSTVTLHIGVLEKKQETISVAICEGDFYKVGEERFSEEGEHIIHLTAANGCDSVITLNLRYNDSYADTTFAAINIGEEYSWQGDIYRTGGTYAKGCIASNGCDSMQVLCLTVDKNCQFTRDTNVVLCYGESIIWYDSTYTISGEYQHLLDYNDRCDTLVTMHLTILSETITDTAKIIIADNDIPYLWREQTYNATGQYSDTIKYATTDCDSAIYVLDLTVLTTGAIEETDTTICESALPFLWYDSTLISTGKYTHDETYKGTDIDSVQHILNLTINPTKYTEETVVACDSYTWNGETYTQSGEYVYTTTAANGCDSIVTLHLTINKTRYAEEAITACDSYTWNGETYTQSGEYVYTTVASNGCDSIVTLHLIINQSEVGAPVFATICYGETYTWNGQTYSTEGEYSITLSNNLGCDSVATLHLTIMPEAVTTTETVVIGSDELPYTWRGNTYSATGCYTVVEQYTTVACDSIIHLLDLTVLTTGNHDEQSVTICETEAPYIWYGESYSATGKYTYTEKYAGTDIDSIQHILNLTVNPTVYTEETMVACDSYTWNGETYTLSGDYTYTTTAANGCDSIVTLHLTINNSEIGETEYATICHGETYTWNGQTHSTEGEYSITLSNTLGCDSVATLHLTIMPEATTTTETIVIGSDELPYTWRGHTYSATGRYTVVEQYTNVACDSAIHVLDLTVLTTGNYDEQSVTICDSEAPYLWYGESYSATGKYTYTEKYVGTDIDSIQHILNLTVNPTVYTEEHITACDSYTWNGETYTQGGEYVYTTTATNGCDSIVTLHLTINQTKYAEEAITACDSYTWNGETYTESGDYVYTTVASNGCDSIVTLHLTINHSEIAALEYITICYGETYTWHGQTYAETGSYDVTLQSIHGCDSIVTLNLTVLPEVIIESQSITISIDDTPYTWHGKPYYDTGLYNDVIKYTNTNCDSVIYELDLRVFMVHTTTIEDTVIICENDLPYHWYNQSLTTSGDYTHSEQFVGTTIDSIRHNLNFIVMPITYGIEEKSITEGETFIWHGREYNTSGEYVDTLHNRYGCDSIAKLVLTVYDNTIIIHHVQTQEQCADEGIVEISVDLEGHVDSIGLDFGSQWNNLDTIVPAPADGQVYISYEGAHIRAGIYEATLTGYFHQNIVFTTPISLSFLYPSTVLEQRWNDVICVLAKDFNGGYDFTAFQWYKDGKLLVGENRSYLSQALEMGSEYSALLTESNGTQLMTCPMIAIEHADITLYPTVVKALQQINCHVSVGADMYLYDATGKLYLTNTLKQGDNEFFAPNGNGIYLIKIVLRTGEEKDAKILVL